MAVDEFGGTIVDAPRDEFGGLVVDPGAISGTAAPARPEARELDPGIRAEIEETGIVESGLIATGKTLYDAGRALNIIDAPETPFEKEAYAGLKQEHPYSTFAGEVVGEAAPFLPFGVAAAGIRPLAGRALATGLVGAAEGGLLTAAGGGDVEETGIGAGLGGVIAGGAELFLPVLGRLGRKVFNNVTGRTPKGSLMRPDGLPTDEMMEALDKAGLTWEDLKVEAQDLIAKQTPGAAPEEVARLAGFEQMGAPALKGEISKDFAERKLEQQLLESGSEKAAEPLRQVKRQQSEAMRGELDSLVDNLGITGETGEAMKGALNQRRAYLQSERKGLYGELAAESQKLGTGAERGATTPFFHGTPHQWAPEVIEAGGKRTTFPAGRPDLSKMGTGEGAQAYGWGFYGAEAKGTAETYAKELYKDADIKEINKRISAVSKKMEPYRTGEYRKFNDPKGYELADEYDNLLSERQGIVDEEYLYELDVPQDVTNKMLDWDAPLSEQNADVQKMWGDFLKTDVGKEADRATGGWISQRKGQYANPKGKDIYSAIYEGMGAAADGNQRAAMYLKERGIPGNKFLDQASRGAGEGTSNYVLWDQKAIDDMVRVKKLGGEAVAQPTSMYPIISEPILSALPDKGTIRDIASMAPLPYKALNDLLVEFGIEQGEEAVASAAQRGIEITPLGLHNFESFRKRLGRIGGQDPAMGVLTGPLKTALDAEIDVATAAMEGVGGNIGEMAKAARRANIALKTEFDEKSITSKLIDPVKRGSTIPKVEASKAYNSVMAPNTPIENLDRLMGSFAEAGAPGQKAVAEMQGRAVLDLVDSAFSAQSRQIDGQRVFGAVPFSKQYEKLLPKLEVLFAGDPKALARLKNVYERSQDIIPPAGAVPKGSAGFFVDALNKIGVYSVASKIPFAREVFEIAQQAGGSATARNNAKKALNAKPKVLETANMIQREFPQIAAALGIAALIEAEAPQKAMEAIE